MGIFGGSKKKLEALASARNKNILEEILKATSGADVAKETTCSVYFKIVGFKPCKEGIGCSLLVANTAMALAKLGLSVCVMDTSMLNPSQDILLNTGNTSKEDWLEMPYTNSNVLSVSKRNSKINVLSFRNRGVIDLLSISDNEELCEIAFTQLLDKYDVFLIDLSNEPSAVSVACMQHCHKVIQVWSNFPHCLNSVSTFVESNVSLCCPLEKMSSVVTSMVIDDIKTDWETILSKYKFRQIGNIPMSLEVARVVSLGKLPFGYQSPSEGIRLYNDCIQSVVSEIVEVTVGEPENFTGRTLDDAETSDSAASDGVVAEKEAEVAEEKVSDKTESEALEDDFDLQDDDDEMLEDDFDLSDVPEVDEEEEKG